MEGGVTKPDKTEFTECWRTTWKTPYIMRLALSAGIGGLLFGYDTGMKVLPCFIYFRIGFLCQFAQDVQLSMVYNMIKFVFHHH